MRHARVGPLAWWVPWGWEVLTATLALWVPFPPVSVFPIMPQRMSEGEGRRGKRRMDQVYVMGMMLPVNPFGIPQHLSILSCGHLGS